MNKLDIGAEESTLRAVVRRKAAEVARKKRIFGSQNRVPGLDVQALDKQRAEKQTREQAEKQQKKEYDAFCLSMDQMMVRDEIEADKRKRELAKELEQYRAMYQRAENSRDADLIYKRQGLTDNLDNLKSVGPASMQVFQGEGVNEDEKKRKQMVQNEKMLRAQREEREKREQEQKHYELLRDREQIKQDMRAVELDALEEECKKAACLALKSYNQAQAEERIEREKQERLKKEELDLTEVLHMVNSDLLTERPDVADKGDAGLVKMSQVLPDRWKGMSSEQLGRIYKQRAEQRADRERQEQLERHKEEVWGFQQLKEARQQNEDEKRLRKLERERRTQLDRYNQQLAKDQQAHQQYLNNELYTNQPTACYFTQFSTSSR